MAREIFVDTSGFYALLIADDDRHDAVLRIMKDAQRRKLTFVTTDHVLDETATLLKARKQAYLLPQFFQNLDASKAIRIEWTDAERFRLCRNFFLKHSDKDWSFTDCLSFCVMKQFRIHDALTKDSHFQQAGFVVLLK